MEKYLAESRHAAQVLGPVTQNGGLTGTRVSMKNARRVSFLLSWGTSTSATGNTMTARQHNAASSGTSKDLVQANPYYHKISSATVFTKVEPTVAAAAIDFNPIVADLAAVAVMEVLSEDLDVENAFGWVSVDAGTSGVAKIVSCIALVDLDLKPAYDQAV